MEELQHNVVDTGAGVVQRPYFDMKTGENSLKEVVISRASALQRAVERQERDQTLPGVSTSKGLLIYGTSFSTRRFRSENDGGLLEVTENLCVGVTTDEIGDIENNVNVIEDTRGL